MDLRKLKLLNSKVYEGREYTAQDISTLNRNEDYHFYGGRVEYYSVAKNNKNVVLLLEAYDNSYRVVDIGIDTSITAKKVVEMIDKAVKDLEETKSPLIKFVCPNCNREFKTKAGLGKHIKSCKQE